MEFCATWVTKIVKNHGLVRRQPYAYHAKPGSECYVISHFLGRLQSGLNIAHHLQLEAVVPLLVFFR